FCPDSIVAGDINGDGIADLALANSCDANLSFSLYVGKGDGTFFNQARVPTSMVARSTAFGDFNGDGHDDLVVALSGNIDTQPPGNLSLCLNPILGSTPRILLPGHYPTAVRVADFNSDGKTDIAAVGADGIVSILLGHGDATFEPENSIVMNGG